MTPAGWPVESWLALALFWSAGIVVALIAWARRSRRPEPEPVRGVWLQWHDHPTDPLKRICSGAESCRGSGIYVMYDHRGDCAYVGQAINFPQRAKQHAKDRKSDVWDRGEFWPTPWWRLSAVETQTCAALRPYQNRTKGGSARPRLRAVIKARWNERKAA